LQVLLASLQMGQQRQQLQQQQVVLVVMQGSLLQGRHPQA
jgi:hypothetical protein